MIGSRASGVEDFLGNLSLLRLLQRRLSEYRNKLFELIGFMDPAGKLQKSGKRMRKKYSVHPRLAL